MKTVKQKLQKFYRGQTIREEKDENRTAALCDTSVWIHYAFALSTENKISEIHLQTVMNHW